MSEQMVCIVENAVLDSSASTIVVVVSGSCYQVLLVKTLFVLGRCVSGEIGEEENRDEEG